MRPLPTAKVPRMRPSSASPSPATQRPRFTPSPLLIAGVAVMLGACSAAPRVPAAASEPPPAPSAPVAPEASPAPPPGAAGKLAPGMVDKVSPVPAFMGLGEHFNIEIQAEDAQRHRVHLVWGSGTWSADGTVFHRGTPGPKHDGVIALDGTLDTAKGTRAIRVEIRTGHCVDEADRPHPQSVTVQVEGESLLQGCGDLAVY